MLRHEFIIIFPRRQDALTDVLNIIGRFVLVSEINSTYTFDFSFVLFLIISLEYVFYF